MSKLRAGACACVGSEMNNDSGSAVFDIERRVPPARSVEGAFFSSTPKAKGAGASSKFKEERGEKKGEKKR